MHIAVYPARLRTSSPIPRGWLPKPGKKLKYPILLPEEDAALLQTTTIPIHRRLLYGILHREGIRRGDAAGLRWRQLDLNLGTLRIEDDKTDNSRMFTLDPGVVAALRAWKEMKGETASDDLVLAGDNGRVANLDHLAADLRDDLRAAGVTRSELFEAHGRWGRFVAHTLRHSYVTRSLARGVPEDTVRQHTGHVSNELRRYREFATSVAELHLEDLIPLNEAIPEFAKVGHNVGHNVGQAEIRRSSGAERNPKLLN
jgi:integrase